MKRSRKATTPFSYLKKGDLNVKTKRGVYHNLNDSTYGVQVTDQLIFYFSSDFYRRKFIGECINFRIKFRKQFNKLTTGTMNNHILADIVLYKTIEKRGFRIVKNGVNQTWQEMYQYALQKEIEKSMQG